MTLSTKIEVFLRILHLFAVGLHTCTAVPLRQLGFLVLCYFRICYPIHS